MAFPDPWDVLAMPDYVGFCWVLCPDLSQLMGMLERGRLAFCASERPTGVTCLEMDEWKWLKQGLWAVSYCVSV